MSVGGVNGGTYNYKDIGNFLKDVSKGNTSSGTIKVGNESVNVTVVSTENSFLKKLNEKFNTNFGTKYKFTDLNSRDGRAVTKHQMFKQLDAIKKNFKASISANNGEDCSAVIYNRYISFKGQSSGNTTKKENIDDIARGKSLSKVDKEKNISMISEAYMKLANLSTIKNLNNDQNAAMTSVVDFVKENRDEFFDAAKNLEGADKERTIEMLRLAGFTNEDIEKLNKL